MDEKYLDTLIEFMREDQRLCASAAATDRALTPTRIEKLNARLRKQKEIVEVLTAYKGLLA